VLISLAANEQCIKSFSSLVRWWITIWNIRGSGFVMLGQECTSTNGFCAMTMLPRMQYFPPRSSRWKYRSWSGNIQPTLLISFHVSAFSSLLRVTTPRDDTLKPRRRSGRLRLSF
jgi:hypothetical protein